MYTKRTIYSWHEIYNLRPGTKFTDALGHEFTAEGEGRVSHFSGSFIGYDHIEMPVTAIDHGPGKLRVRKLQGLERWAAIGTGIYESFDTHHQAIHWAQWRARE